MPEDSRLPGYLAAWPRAWLALSLANLGRFADAIAFGDDAVKIADAAAHPHSQIEARAALGRVHLARGDLGRATALLESGLVPSRDWNMWDSSVFSSLGYAYVLAGRVGDGLALLQEAVDRGQSIDALGIVHAMRLSRLGEGYLLAGRLHEARERTQQALEISTTQEERANEAYALWLLGEIVSLGEHAEAVEARRCLTGALALASQLGMRPLVAHCHLGLGKLHRRADKRDQAQEHLTTASTMYAEMGMASCLKKAEAELQ